MSDTCPRCQVPEPLADGQGALDERICRACNGRFLPPLSAERVLQRELGHTPAFLRELTSHFAGGRLPCPGCGQRMSAVTLRGTSVDLCTHCGGLWLDRGELTRLSVGRHVEVELQPLPKEPPPEPPPPRNPSLVNDLALMVTSGGWDISRGPDGVVGIRPTLFVRRVKRGLAVAMFGAAFLALGVAGVTVGNLAAVAAVTGFILWILRDWDLRAQPHSLTVANDLLGVHWTNRLQGEGVIRHRARSDEEGRIHFYLDVHAPGSWGSTFALASASGQAINEAATALQEATGWPVEWE